MDLNLRKLFGAFLCFSAVSCATNIRKAELSPTADPAEETTQLESDIRAAEADHIPVLAPKDFDQSVKYLEEAKDDMVDEGEREEVLRDIAYGRAYLERAIQTAEPRRPQISQILEARGNAIEAGAGLDANLNKDLKRLDKRLKSNSDNFRKNFSSDEYAEIQTKYLNLELAAIQNKYLATARSQIADAKKKQKADDRAPASFKKAETDLKAAENAIAVSRYDVPSFSDDVITANNSAKSLNEVLRIMRTNNLEEEAVAVRLVRQSQKINKLQGSLQAAESDMENMDSTLKRQGRQLSSAERAVAIQQAIDKSRQEFSNEDAEAFQQGNSLVIRLKKVSFASGSSELPRSAIPLLSKVESVVKELNPQSLVVEGHTDSTGGQKTNMALSQRRAEIVAAYLEKHMNQRAKIEAVGHGDSKPIASNKSKEGRAQNRRVDIVVNAGGLAESQLSEL